MTRAITRWLLLAVFAAPLASAQPAAAPEPIVTATIDPPRVVVGQKATLLVTVLAPNYMPSPPILPEFQLRNVVTRSLGAINQVETRDGVTYAGVRYEFAIFPQELGSFAIAGQKVTVTYAADPPQSRTATIELPRLAFEGFIPDAAQGLDPFLAATSLSVGQVVKQSSQELKVGDSVTRTVTIKAQGTPAMLLPPVAFTEISGLARYPAQPALSENIDRRTGALAATRVDEATYMLEQAGDYTLPATELAWWYARDSKVERIRTGTIVFHVVDNPTARAGESGKASMSGRDWRAPVGWILDHWLLCVAVLSALGALVWLASAAVRTAYLGYEAWSFAQLRAAAHDRNSAKVYFALLSWVGRFDPLAPNRSLDALKQAARDPALDREIASIETKLFAPQGSDSIAWSPRPLLRRVEIARRQLQRSPSTPTARRALPDNLNPVAARQQILPQLRPVAR
jgi:hypothetical protein